MSRQQRDWSHTKPGGHYSSPTSTLCSTIDWVPRMVRPTPSHKFMRFHTLYLAIKPSFPNLALQLWCSGKSWRKSYKLSRMITYLPSAMIPMSILLSMQEEVMCWVHTSLSSGHPGIRRTETSREHVLVGNLKMLKGMLMLTLSVPKAKPIGQLPTGLLQSLPIPQRTWSHIIINFITDLPNSQGYSTIMTISNCFSKLLTVIQTAKIFRLYGLPEDIVSDCGFQFTARVWQGCCKKIQYHWGSVTSSLDFPTPDHQRASSPEY